MSIYVQLELRLVNSLVLPRLLFIILEISDYKADQRAKRTMHEKNCGRSFIAKNISRLQEKLRT